MAFLFKSSKKGQERAVASRDGTPGSQSSIQSNASRAARDEKVLAQQRATPTGSLNSLDNEAVPASPDRAVQRRQGGSIDQTHPGDAPSRNGPPPSSMNNSSLYPWSQRRLTYTSTHPPPFPRYGAAVNSVSSKEGDVYLMGGLINSSTVKGDLWMIEAGGNMACYPIATTAEGPGPRVGHASLLVGNAFIVYGGDTKMDESDVLDETLYLLNTSTRQWSRALPAGPRPSGRYGHSLNILGSKIFIFGGQVEGYFMNDVSAFDLNQLQMPNNRWEILLQGDASPKMPAPRTNHSIITYQDKLYLFGGTNGFQWFNDVWCYDATANKWTQFECIGYIPSAREGHSAALVDDVMYIFGGRTEEGTDLGDLAAFRIASCRWYTFQNMGPSPSPRSGHSMTTVGKSLVVLGGEPSSATASVNDLGILYVLDTTKIRYPADNQAQQGTSQKIVQGQGRRPSNEAPRAVLGRDGSAGPQDRRGMASPANLNNVPNGHRSPSNPLDSPGLAGANSRLPRAAGSAPAGPPPQGPVPVKPTVETTSLGRVRGPSADRSGPIVSPQVGSTQSPISREVIPEKEIPIVNGRRTPTQAQQQQPTRAAPKVEHAAPVNQPKQSRPKSFIDNSTEGALRAVAPRPASPPPPTRQPSNPLSRRSSGRNSQTVALLKELDSSRNRNAWYASELELARKAGYVPSTSVGSALDSKVTETFDDEDRPLIEALLAMRTELANVQAAVDKQAIVAAKQIAEAETQRDAAIQEAVYAKAKLAAHAGDGSSVYTDEGQVRSNEMSKKLATTLYLQKDLQSRLEASKAELEAEKRARQLADDTFQATQKRMADLENYKQQTSGEAERLKAELHAAQREAREHSVTSAEAVGALQLLKVDKDDLDSRHRELADASAGHNSTFDSLKVAIVASDEAKEHLQAKLDDERAHREKAETKLTSLKAELEARTTELVAATQRLRDAEELAEKHANEARTHRLAVVSGLDKMSLRNESRSGSADADRVAALQSQVTAGSAMVKKYQQETDSAADKLRSAEERIAGLEQYQEQSSREGVTIRRQLQSSLKDTQGLQAFNSDLKNQLAAQQLETNAMTVQLSALKDILSERGISPTAAVRSRGLASPRTNSPEMGKLRDLEAQLVNAAAAHEDTKQIFAMQAQESEIMYREKLSQLEGDYQSAVHYVKGTEKMLKQLKDQMTRYKTENTQLKSDVVELEDQLQAEGSTGADASAWDTERNSLQGRIESLETELRSSRARMQRDLENLRLELNDSKLRGDHAVKSGDEVMKQLNLQRKQLEQMRSDNALMEQRANDAEQKVSLLLDQVEHSVDNYRRQSRQAASMHSDTIPVATNGLGHSRNESSEVESVYEGDNDARNSTALDNLASELETLRTHWEATSKNYRLSTNFDLDSTNAGKRDDDGAGLGLSESLADWRKKLETEENATQGKPRV